MDANKPHKSLRFLLALEDQAQLEAVPIPDSAQLVTSASRDHAVHLILNHQSASTPALVEDRLLETVSLEAVLPVTVALQTINVARPAIHLSAQMEPKQLEDVLTDFVEPDTPAQTVSAAPRPHHHQSVSMDLQLLELASHHALEMLVEDRLSLITVDLDTPAPLETFAVQQLAALMEESQLGQPSTDSAQLDTRLRVTNVAQLSPPVSREKKTLVSQSTDFAPLAQPFVEPSAACRLHLVALYRSPRPALLRFSPVHVSQANQLLTHVEVCLDMLAVQMLKVPAILRLSAVLSSIMRQLLILLVQPSVEAAQSITLL